MCTNDHEFTRGLTHARLRWLELCERLWEIALGTEGSQYPLSLCTHCGQAWCLTTEAARELRPEQRRLVQGCADVSQPITCVACATTRAERVGL